MAWNGCVTLGSLHLLLRILYTSPGLHFLPRALVKPGLLIGRGTSSGQAADFIRRDSSGDGISNSHISFKLSWTIWTAVSVLTF